MAFPTDKKDPEDKGRTIQEVSKDITEPDDGMDKDDPADKKLPEPKPKTPEELLEDPDKVVVDGDTTGE